MSTIPVVNFSFSIDLSGNAVPITSTLANPSTLPTTYIQIDCSKSQVFPSGINYNIVTNASGVITTLSGAVHTNSLNTTHVSSRAGTTGSWRNATLAGNIFDLSFNFNSVNRTAKYNLAKAATILTGANDLGRHVMLMVTHALRMQEPVTQTDIFDAATVTSAAATINTNITNAIRTVLNTQAAQNTLLQAIMRSNGPVVPVITTANTNQTLSLAFDATWSNMILNFVIDSLPVNVSYYGKSYALVLRNLPLYVNLTV
jgi:hypothetical protein